VINQENEKKESFKSGEIDFGVIMEKLKQTMTLLEHSITDISAKMSMHSMSLDGKYAGFYASLLLSRKKTVMSNLTNINNLLLELHNTGISITQIEQVKKEHSADFNKLIEWCVLTQKDVEELITFIKKYNINISTMNIYHLTDAKEVATSILNYFQYTEIQINESRKTLDERFIAAYLDFFNTNKKVNFKNKLSKPNPFSPFDDYQYEYYTAKNMEDAEEFLKTYPVHLNYYYVEVETPEGNIGRDINGIY
jgi:hypothetical protein